MKLRMAENSVFAILLRSPWWISFALGFGIFALARLWVPPLYAAAVPIPLLVIGCIAAWRQLRTPGAARVAERLEALRALTWSEFSAAIEAAYAGEGYEVRRLKVPQADFELMRDGRKVLVGCKRWKVAHSGAGPLRELQAVGHARHADELRYIAAGELTEQARAFAAKKDIRIVEGAALVTLLEPGRRAARP